MASATVGILRVLLSANTAEFTAALEKASDHMKGWQRELSTMGQQATAAGSLLTAGITVPLTALAAGAIKASSDFESAFANVAKTVDGVADSAGKLTPAGEALAQTFRDLAKEIPATREELSEIAALGGQMGVPIENLAHFTRNVAALGVAVDGISTETAAAGLAAVGNAAGVGTTQIAEMASALVHLGNNSNATEGQILEMTQRLIGAGTTVGMTIPQVMALATTMANVGIEAEKGGTAMSTVITRIGVAVSTESPKLAEFARVAGLTAEEFTTKWRTAPVEAIQLVIEGLGRMKANGADLNLAMIELGLSGIRVSDVMKLVAGNATDVGRTVAIANEGFSAANKHIEEAQKKYGTLSNELRTLWNRITDVAVTLGDALVPVLRIAIQAVTALIPVAEMVAKAFAAMPMPVQAVIVVVGGLMAVIGPLLLAFGALVMAITPLLPLLSLLVPTVSAVIAILSALALPIAAIGAALVALTVIWVKWGEDIKRVVADTFNTVRNWLVTQWEGSIFQSVARMLQSMGELYVALQVRIAAEVLKIYTAVKEWLVDKLTPIFTTVKNFLEPVATLWTAAKDKVIAVVTALYTGVKTWLVDKFVDIVNGIKAKIDAVTGFFKSMKDAVVGNSYVPEMVGLIGVHIARLDGLMVQPVLKYTDGVSDLFAGMKTESLGLMGELINGVGKQTDRYPTVLTNPTQQASSLTQTIFGAMSQGVQGIVGNLFNRVQGNTVSFGSTFTGTIGGISQGTQGIFNALSQGVQQIVGNMFNSLLGQAQSWGGMFMGILNNIIGAGISALVSWGLGQLGRLIGGWIGGGEEGTQVNPARDQFLAQFGGSGTGEGSGFWNLGVRLEGAVGSAQAEALHAALRAADTMAAFNAAVAAINQALGGGFSGTQASGVIGDPSFGNFGGAPGATPAGGELNQIPSWVGQEAPEEDMGALERMARGMSSGGFGHLERPTLFFGHPDEDFAFSGQGKSFKDFMGGDSGLKVENHFHGDVYGLDDFEDKVMEGWLNAVRLNKNSALTRVQAVSEIG